MGKEIRMIYDDEGDVLDVSLGVPVAAVSREMDDDFFVRIEPNSGEVVGFSILDFKNQAFGGFFWCTKGYLNFWGICAAPPGKKKQELLAQAHSQAGAWEREKTRDERK